jgi:hypothetical protein
MFANLVRANLLAIAAAYARERGISISAVSKKFYGNSIFFRLLRDGNEAVTVPTVDRMLRKFRDEWPEGADIPFLPIIDMTKDFGKRVTHKRDGGGRANRLSRRHENGKPESGRGGRRLPPGADGQRDAAPPETVRRGGRDAANRGGRGTATRPPRR